MNTHGAQIPTDFIRAFMDHYFPAQLPVVKSIAGFAERAHDYAGSYRTNRRNFTDNEKFLNLFGGTQVAPTGEGTLMVTGYDTQQFAEIAPGVWARVRHSAGIVAALVFVGFLAYWNLIGFRFG